MGNCEKNMKHIRTVSTTGLFFLLCLMTLAVCRPAGAHIYRVADNQTISFPQLLADLETARVIFHGELHDSREHHRSQLQLIRALHEKGHKLAVGLEMVPKHRQDALDKWVAGELDPWIFRKIFSSYWGYWSLYRDILFYARQKNIPLIGLNVPKEITRKIARHGFDSLEEQDLEEIPAVSCIISDEYEKFIRRALGAHAQHPGTFENFCEAQLLWDKAMAENLLEFIEKDADAHLIVVLAGGGHSWKHGIPAHLAARSEVSYKVLLPEISGRWIPGRIDARDADYILQGLELGGLH